MRLISKGVIPKNDDKVVSASETWYSKEFGIYDPRFMMIIVEGYGSGTLTVTFEDSHRSSNADLGFAPRTVLTEATVNLGGSASSPGINRQEFTVWNQAANDASGVQALQPFGRVKLEETGGANDVNLLNVMVCFYAGG